MTAPTVAPPAVGPALQLDPDTLNTGFEAASAAEVIRWAADTFGTGLTLAASMADTVLVHLATTVDPDLDVAFLDTGFHFAETLATVRQAQSRYRLNLRVERPVPDAPDLFAVGTDGCCAARKVALLDRALEGKAAWMTGLRRTDATTRAATPIVSIDKRGLVKICPIATWTDEQVDDYIQLHALVVNPLLTQGYPSIGCWPCTEPVVEGEDARAGRWAGSTKTECGLHL